MISVIVATAKDGVIGKTGGIPWYLPADLAHFKQTTMGHPIIMGRVTHESIGKALPGRRNIVISHNAKYQAEGCDVVDSLESALKLVENEPEVFIIGGEAIYNLALPLAEQLYLTKVNAKIDGDKHFLYNPAEWKGLSREEHTADDKNPYDYTFITLERAE
jgi:dihydrofolate reductase